MSISAADRARQSDRISQTREDAEEREAKLLKRKNEQLKRAEQRHQQEIGKLTEAYQSQLGKAREEQKETLTEREHDHQDELSNVRKTYQGNMQQKMEANDTDKKILRDTYETEIEKNKTVNKMQKQELLSKQERELAKRDESLAVVTVGAQDKMKEAMNDNSRRLREAHDKEINVLKNHMDDSQMQTELEKNQMRKAYESQRLANLRQDGYKEAEWKQKYQDLYNEVNDTQANGQNATSALLSEGLKNVKNTYEKKLQNRTEQMDKSNEMFRDTVSNRVDTQVRSRDSKIQNLSTKLNNELVNDKRMRQMDRNNLQSSYEDKMKDLVEQKEMTKETMQGLNNKRIGEMKEKNDHLLRQANQDYRSQMDIEKARFRESTLTLAQLKDDELNRANNRADNRIDKIQKTSELNVKRMGDFYEDNIDLARESFDKKVVDQRERNMELQGQSNRMMSERFRKIENTYQKKLESAVNTYEAKIQEMKDKHDKEVRMLQANNKLMMEDKEKGHRTDRDSTEMKYEARIAMMEQEHQERMGQVQKRHQEELRDLALKLNQYNKKP